MGDVTDFPGAGPGTEKEKYTAAVHRQNGTTESEDEKNDRLCKEALQRMYGPPGQETRTHWADGSAKTPEELRLLSPIEKKTPVSLLRKQRIAALLSSAGKAAPPSAIIMRLDAIDTRLHRIERVLRMRRRVRT